jgi:hypothetical protein
MSVISYNNGEYSKDELFEGVKTKHPNLLRHFILGKKSWGLWLNQWSEGVAEGTFTKYEILKQFKQYKIKIPDCLRIDFDNRIWKFRYEKYHT